jgi:hypothetical protein
MEQGEHNRDYSLRADIYDHAVLILQAAATIDLLTGNKNE